MMEAFGKWSASSGPEILMSLASVVVVYAALILYTRITGLRSFSKMSSFDFAMTIAVGSVFGATITAPKPPLLIGLTALAGLFFGQWAVAKLRRKFDFPEKLVDNKPVLLMAGSTILEENMRQTSVTMSDLHGKLREANVLNYDQVRAVVFETTGDISVLHATDQNEELDPIILEGVLGTDSLKAEATNLRTKD